jgi:MFS family permease
VEYDCGVVAIDRIGKGIRTAPRDALISQRTPRCSLGTAFGVHRGMDAGGAMLGPILAFLLLAAAPGNYDLLFVTSFGAALIGLAAILLLVPSELATDRPAVQTAVSLRSASRLLEDVRFARLVFGGSLLGLATISDSFILLILQKELGFGATAFPLLYVGTSLFTSLFSVPCGRLSDSVGRRHVLVGGYVVLAAVYGLLLGFPDGSIPAAALVIALLGAYYASTEGVLTAMAAAVLPAGHAGSGLAVLATATNLARLTSSVAFGWLWATAGLESAAAVSLVALVVAIVAAPSLSGARLMPRHEPAAGVTPDRRRILALPPSASSCPQESLSTRSSPVIRYLPAPRAGPSPWILRSSLPSARYPTCCSASRPLTALTGVSASSRSTGPMLHLS